MDFHIALTDERLRRCVLQRAEVADGQRQREHHDQRGDARALRQGGQPLGRFLLRLLLLLRVALRLFRRGLGRVSGHNQTPLSALCSARRIFFLFGKRLLDVGQLGQQGFGGLLRALPVAVRVGGGIGLRLFGQLPRAAPDVARGLFADAPLHRQRIGGAGETERRGHLALPERDGHFQRGLQAEQVVSSLA